jgi:hypothetical protein
MLELCRIELGASRQSHIGGKAMNILGFLAKLVLFLLILGFTVGFLLADSTQATEASCLKSVVGPAILLTELAPPLAH